MHVKEKFTTTGYYHILAGCCIILFVFANTVGFLSQQAVLMTFVIFILVGIAICYIGYKAVSANRSAIIALIIFNALHVINFDLDHLTYHVTVGPYVAFDILDGALSFGIEEQLWLGYSSAADSVGNFFKVNLIHLGFLVYLLDQLRFIPDRKSTPWEAEYLEQPKEEEKLEHQLQ